MSGARAGRSWPTSGRSRAARSSGGGRLGSPLLGACRLAVYLGLTLLLIPVQYGLVAAGRPARKRLPRFYHRLCTRLLGLRVVVHGAPSAAAPTLFVSNHSSYLDIMVLGSLLRVSFVAKAEVAGWPLFGTLAKLQETVFVDRRVGTTHNQRDAIADRLRAGDDLILFAEGTTSDGNRTLPFKSALFAVADHAPGGRPLPVQPVSITCTALDRIPLGRALRPFYAWYGDTELVAHIWAMSGLGELTVEVVFHPPVTLAELGSRKALAEHCWRRVADGVARANAGRLTAGRAAAADDGTAQREDPSG